MEGSRGKVTEQGRRGQIQPLEAVANTLMKQSRVLVRALRTLSPGAALLREPPCTMLGMPFTSVDA